MPRTVSPLGLALGVAACGAPATSSDLGFEGAAEAEPTATPQQTPAPSAAEPAAETPAAPSALISDDDILVDVIAAPVALEECTKRLAGTEETRALLDPFATRHERFARRTLYSWTVPEQVAELRSEAVLLTRATSAGGERGKSADVIIAARDSDPMAALLAETRFEKRRFAWTNPWATMLGISGEGYGDQLLSITLKAEAIVGRLVASPSGLDWSFQTMSGEAVEPEAVLANPDLLAAIYFVDVRDPSYCGGEFSNVGSVMREYFLCNEAMIESWSAFTPEVAAEVSRGIAALEVLESALEGRACLEPSSGLDLSPQCWRTQVAAEWEGEAEVSEGLLQAYDAALAFPTDLYLPRADNIRRLIDLLQQVPLDEEPLVYAAE